MMISQVKRRKQNLPFSYQLVSPKEIAKPFGKIIITGKTNVANLYRKAEKVMERSLRNGVHFV